MATSFFGKFNPSRTQSNQRQKINIRNQRENTGPSTKNENAKTAPDNLYKLEFYSLCLLIKTGSSINIIPDIGSLRITSSWLHAEDRQCSWSLS